MRLSFNKINFVLGLLVFSATLPMIADSAFATEKKEEKPAAVAEAPKFDASKLEFEDALIYKQLETSPNFAASKEAMEKDLLKLIGDYKKAVEELAKPLCDAAAIEKITKEYDEAGKAKGDAGKADADKKKDDDMKKLIDAVISSLSGKIDDKDAKKADKEAAQKKLLEIENRHSEDREALTVKYAKIVLNDAGKVTFDNLIKDWKEVGIKDTASGAQIKKKYKGADDKEVEGTSADALKFALTIWDKAKRQGILKELRDERLKLVDAILKANATKAEDAKAAGVAAGTVVNNVTQITGSGQIVAGAGGDVIIKYCDMASKDIQKEAFQMLCIGGGNPAIVDCAKGTLKGGFQLTFDKACYAMATDAVHNVEYYQHAKKTGAGGGRVPSYNQEDDLKKMIDWEHLDEIYAEKHSGDKKEGGAPAGGASDTTKKQ